IVDPHAWLLAHRDDPLLAAARERLVASPDDADRCVRVVLRRCGLVLINVVTEKRIVVRHWGKVVPDLRAWAKEHGWNRPRIEVVFVNEKNGRVVVHPDGEDVLLHGGRVGGGFPWAEYMVWYELRSVEESDD